MREELTLIIERLTPSGVPEISPLVLLLAACRGKIADERLVAELFGRSAVPGAAPLGACAQLAALSAMPRELLAGVPSKTSLASLVFADAKKMTPSDASAVLAVLREGLPPSAWHDSSAHPGRRRLVEVLLGVETPRPAQPAPDPVPRRAAFLKQLRTLHDGLAPLDAEKIAHALRTGIPEAPRAAEVDLPLGESVLALLRELQGDGEFPGLAQIVRDVMAAIVLPRALPEPEHDSPGGFADIGNRGELHRLLLSELAHDDDTLAARVALGEALYLRREPAANPPPATLALLLDSGLRMWGVPRVFGAAVALACLAKAPPHQGALAFRAAGAIAEQLALHTRAGLTAHLAALDTSLNPADALAPLAAKLRTAGSRLDVIIVTHPFALEDADFNAACAAQRDAGIHVATVDREGAFALHLRTPGGWQPIASARLKLDALFAPPPRRAAARQPPQLPAMLRRERCAFLLPISQRLRASCVISRGSDHPHSEPATTAGITEDGSLWIWTDPVKHGAIREPWVHLAGTLLTLLIDDTTKCLIAVGHASAGGRLNLLRRFCDSHESKTHVTELSAPMERPVRCWTDGGHLFLAAKRNVHVINIATGAVVTEASVPAGAVWLGNRCLIRSESDIRSILMVTFDGIRVVFELLRHQWLQRSSKHVLYAVRHPQKEETWMLDTEGRFFDLESGALRFDTHLGPFSVVRELDGGERLLICDRRAQHKFIRLSPTQITPAHGWEIKEAGAAGPRMWTLRNKFTHIAAHPSGRVWLRAQRGYWVAIGLRETGRSFALERQADGSVPPSSAAFGEPEKIAHHGCALSFAELRGGGRAWLDSRGMLHLEAADPFAQEITIVLAESASLPVWCSDKIIVGPEYFLGESRARPGDAEKIDGYLRAFVSGCQ